MNANDVDTRHKESRDNKSHDQLSDTPQHHHHQQQQQQQQPQHFSPQKPKRNVVSLVSSTPRFDSPGTGRNGVGGWGRQASLLSISPACIEGDKDDKDTRQTQHECRGDDRLREDFSASGEFRRNNHNRAMSRDERRASYANNPGNSMSSRSINTMGGYSFDESADVYNINAPHPGGGHGRRWSAYGTNGGGDGGNGGGGGKRRRRRKDRKPENERDAVQDRLTRTATHRIRCLRIFLYLFIVFAGIGVVVLAVKLMPQDEIDDYYKRFHAFGDAFAKRTILSALRFQEGANGLSALITQTATNDAGGGASPMSFPHVTVPAFDLYATYFLRQQSHALQILWVPFVENEEDALDAWTNYTGSTVYEIDLNDGLSRVNTTATPSSGEQVLGPILQTSPGGSPISNGLLNFNTLSIDSFQQAVEHMRINQEPVFLSTIGSDVNTSASDAWLAKDSLGIDYDDIANPSSTSIELLGRDGPRSYMLQPVFSEQWDRNSTLVGVLTIMVAWDSFLVAPEQTDMGLFCVLRNTCGESFTYFVVDQRVSFLGKGDLSEGRRLDHSEMVVPFGTNQLKKYPEQEQYTVVCDYSFALYATQSSYDYITSNRPAVEAATMASILFLFLLTFLLYDHFARKRNRHVQRAASQMNAVVSSLFPTTIANRLMEGTNAFGKMITDFANRGIDDCDSDLECGAAENGDTSCDGVGGDAYFDANGEMIVNGNVGYTGFLDQPIAELFPDATIMFAAVDGFAEWSSIREPTHIFQLLETLYRAFDETTKRYGVYKIETIGNSYVAVTGVPNRRRNHASAMCRFAGDLILTMNSLKKRLEPLLGPDTVDLDLRIGIHSGPVVGGVLRGDKSRFQLFGDTMNTASRMESRGQRGLVQLSQDTVDLLISAGKTDWVRLRESTVYAKGKGELQTYWLNLDVVNESSHVNMKTAELNEDDVATEDQIVTPEARLDLLINWNTELFLDIIKALVARREARGLKPERITINERRFTAYGETALDEVKDVVDFPLEHENGEVQEQHPSARDLDPAVAEQAHAFISNIAHMYNSENPYHNFEHASHVTTSMCKLFARITGLNSLEEANENRPDKSYIKAAASHPLTQLACVFSTLIIDVDHAGVPNAQLILEGAPIADFYKGRCISEQNSLDLAWELFMDDDYIDLREAIYTSDSELSHFRQLVVNAVLATDLSDDKLIRSRNKRWSKAFNEKADFACSLKASKRKATVLLEILVQASDTVHTMQHWNVFRRWQEKYFLESFKAYKEGRGNDNFAEIWYEEQLRFFDLHLIPLAKRLKDCGFFGVLSTEYLDHAVRNRNSWEEQGRNIVSKMCQQYGIELKPTSVDHSLDQHTTGNDE